MQTIHPVPRKSAPRAIRLDPKDADIVITNEAMRRFKARREAAAA